jgi:hypothetical protein
VLVTPAYFTVSDESPSTGTYVAADSTAGPWAAHLQHGGPPNALLVHAAERFVAAETGRADLVAARLSAEFVGPVPVGPVHTAATLVRAARSAVLVEMALSAEGRTCLQSRVWFVADTDTAGVAAPAVALTVPDGPSGLGATSFSYGASIEWRFVSGGMDQIGPGVVWARPRTDLVEGRPLSGLQRAALIGDSASGISAELDWAVWSFLNVDLDIHLARPMQGDWLKLEAATQLGPNGFALAHSTLSDGAGRLGSTAQTLVVAPHRR